MATINAAAASQFNLRGVIAAFAIVCVAGLGGCASNGGSLLQESSSPLANNSTQPAKPAQTARARIAIAPVIGAPDGVAKQLASQLGVEVLKANIAVAKAAGEKVDYTLRGYIVAAREASGTKVSYIWDVTNPTGARVHRITGEEVIAATGSNDPWQSVSPQLVQTIAAKTGASLDKWMPAKTRIQPAAAATTPVANAAPAANIATSSTGQAVPSANGLAPPSGLKPQPGTSPATTGSIGRPATLAAIVPRVQGAPGDGPTSLAAALQSELARNGVRPGNGAAATAYRVEGKVDLGKDNGGQQPIKIDWVVKDPKGNKLGTVSQANNIPAGSLDGTWGSTANAAAVAAAQGIIKLLPRRTAAN